MKKKTLCAAVLLSLTLVAFAEPFGLEMGMTLRQVEQACGGRKAVHIGDIRYYIKPEKTHPSFSEYIAWISPTEGLCFIRANSEEIYLDPTAATVRNKFYRAEDALSKSYGKSILTDELPNWATSLYGLKSGDRLDAQWFPNRSDVVWIVLYVDAIDLDTAVISVYYEFANYKKVEGAQDGVL